MTSQNLNEQLLIAMGAIKKNAKQILSMECVEWELKNEHGSTTTCLSDAGIPLEITSSYASSTHHSIAIKINDGPISEEDVSLPTGITFSDQMSAKETVRKALKIMEQPKETLNCLAHK